MSKLWMISYDISDAKMRKKVHDHLKNHGQRVQFSVFECRLSRLQFEQLRSDLQALIMEQDSIRWYPLCNWCEADIHWQGQGDIVDTNEYYIL